MSEHKKLNIVGIFNNVICKLKKEDILNKFFETCHIDHYTLEVCMKVSSAAKNIDMVFYLFNKYQNISKVKEIPKEKDNILILFRTIASESNTIKILKYIIKEFKLDFYALLQGMKAAVSVKNYEICEFMVDNLSIARKNL